MAKNEDNSSGNVLISPCALLSETIILTRRDRKGFQGSKSLSITSIWRSSNLSPLLQLLAILSMNYCLTIIPRARVGSE